MSTTELGGVLGTPRGTGWELWTAAPFEWQMQETRLRPGGGVPWLLVWIKEQHDLGGADLIRGTWPNTQAWNEFAQLVTKSGHCCLAGPSTTHPSSQGLLGASHGQGLPDM